MRIRAWCDGEKCIGAAMLSAEAPEGRCPLCGSAIRLTPPAKREELEACWRCGCPNLYVEKAFPQSLGCLVMIVSAVAGVAFAAPTYGMSFMAVIVLDFILYFLVPTRTVCYRCSAEYYGAPGNPRHKGHDLLIAGKYADREDVGGPAGH
jgi:hypothetical protein